MTQRVHTVYVDGQHGTTGLEILDLLGRRDDLELLTIAAAHRRDATRRTACLNEADIVVLCLPDDAAREACTLITRPDVRVIDASTAHRVAPGWVYGLPELTATQAGAIAASRRVSNPGCYPTGFLLLVRPLVDAGLVGAAEPLSVHALSGHSGGGRQMIDRYQQAATAGTPIDDPRPYALGLAHKHVAEMRLHAGLATAPLFVPIVGPYYRGMLVQVPLATSRLGRRTGPAQLRALLAERYAGMPCVQVLEPDAMTVDGFLSPEGTNHTNRVELTVTGHADQVLLVARLDNLGKGAAGAAVQNLNLMLGRDPLTGLAT